MRRLVAALFLAAGNGCKAFCGQTLVQGQIKAMTSHRTPRRRTMTQQGACSDASLNGLGRSCECNRVGVNDELHVVAVGPGRILMRGDALQGDPGPERAVADRLQRPFRCSIAPSALAPPGPFRRHPHSKRSGSDASISAAASRSRTTCPNSSASRFSCCQAARHCRSSAVVGGARRRSRPKSRATERPPCRPPRHENRAMRQTTGRWSRRQRR